MAPPVKRQKRLVALRSDHEDAEANSALEPVPTLSRVKATKSDTRGSGIVSQHGRDILPPRRECAAKLNFAGNVQTSRPISLFFRAGTPGLHQVNQKPPKAVASDVEDHEDLIVDDYSIENANDLGYAATETALGGIKKRPPPGRDGTAATNKSRLQIGSQRFKIHERTSSLCITPGTSYGAKAEPSAIDMRPWAEKYSPSTFEELMVHKKKVSDVRQWLEGALRGHNYKVRHSKGNCCCTIADREQETFGS